MNEKPTIKPYELKPITRFIYTIGVLPTSYLMSMTYEEQLTWLCNYISQTLIPALNTNAEAVQELQSLYEDLQNYVNNYFDNLDVQEEINNKLDEMAESGELAQIIAEYLNLTVMYAYDTVDDMKNAENLQNGAIVRTLGFYSYNDRGGAYYKIRPVTTDDVINEMDIIAVYDNTLIAELIKQYPINPLKLGAKADGITDDSAVIQRAIDLGSVDFDRLTFKIDNTIIINGNKVIDFKRATFIGEADPMIKINTTGATSPMTWITLKNGRFETTGSGIEIYNSYFIKVQDITVKLLGATGKGIYFENGFNNTCDNLQIYGDLNNNGCIGIDYAIVNNGSMSWINNITNVKFNSCLIQKVAKGIQLGGTGGSFDSCIMENMGFSSCTNTAYEFGGNSGNWEVINTRCEFCEQLAKISDTAQVNIQGLYLLNSKGIDNAGFLEMSGNIYHFSNDSVNRYTILSNTGEIRFGTFGKWGNNGTTICDNTVKNSKMVASTKAFYTTYNTNFFPQFINIHYTGNSTATVASIQGSEGGEMYLLRRDGDAGWLLPDNTYTTVGRLYHLIYLNGVWNIL